MIDGLRPFPQNKPSTVPWLSDVPAHWDVLRSKYAFREVDSRSTTGEETHLSMSQRLGLVPANQVEKSLVSESYVGAKLVVKDDLVLNRLKAHLGVFAYAKEPGLISPDYTVLRPMTCANVRFFEYVLKSPACRAELRTRAKGIVEGFWRLYTDDFYDIRLPIPPLDEQRLIVRFLDWHGVQTAKLIRAKKKIIALLNEQKQAIIHRAVTRGLDPNVRLKPSGIPWLGDVPEGWEVKPLKHWAGINRRTLSQNTDPDYAFDYVDISAVATGYLSATPERMRFEASPSRARRIVQQGDTLISTVRTYLKAIYHVDRPWPDLIASTGFAVLTPKPSIDARFFGFVLQSKTFVDQVVANSIGVAYPAISETRLGSLHVCLPPSRQEQEGIINHLQTATVDFDRSIEATQREITLIQEFRARLIADVVTGKLDVRAAAASLPETVELEPIDDLVEGDNLDEAVDDAENEEVAA
jgi:type I restriction enzyme S subunit